MLRLRTASASLSTIVPAAVTHPLPLPCTFAQRMKMNWLRKMNKKYRSARVRYMHYFGNLRRLALQAFGPGKGSPGGWPHELIFDSQFLHPYTRAGN